ncbi:MAG TPA: relaxase/mobilization nuclease domain-containing protein [Parasegetibacter sp.]
MKMGKDIKGALSYNEQKVGLGKADLILAARFSRDVTEMGFSEKLARFEKLTALNEKVKTNTLHLSLNFSPDDRLDNETMQKIASDYMERIGFGNQPYLVYHHKDTDHPHLHIVTTTIQSNGRPIYTHNIAKRLSEPARKAIEVDFGLIKAESRRQQNNLPVQGEKIQSIVREVVSSYKFTSLDELNAILRQYNIVADRGYVGGRMYQSKGLVYCAIDEDGYKTGIPIKASAIYTSPTLSMLEKKFAQHQVSKPLLQKRVQTKINDVLSKSWTTTGFMKALKRINIGCSVRYEPGGDITDISFIDHNARAVFSCNELGISITDLLNQLGHAQHKDSEITANTTNNVGRVAAAKSAASFDVFKILLSSQNYQLDLSPEFLKKRKNRKKR